MGVSLVSGSVLLIEDDAAVAEEAAAWLTSSGYTVWHAETGADARAMLKQARPDVILLDLSLPDVDGLVLCPRLQADADNVPIIVTSPNADRRDRLLAFKLGADDFVTKPFDLDELQARIEVVLRRRVRTVEVPHEAPRLPVQSVDVGNLSIDVPRWHVTVGGRRVHLTPTEFNLLVHLANRAGEMVTREQLAHEVWGDDAMTHSRTIDAYVRRVRNKLGNNAAVSTRTWRRVSGRPRRVTRRVHGHEHRAADVQKTGVPRAAIRAFHVEVRNGRIETMGAARGSAGSGSDDRAGGDGAGGAAGAGCAVGRRQRQQRPVRERAE